MSYPLTLKISLFAGQNGSTMYLCREYDQLLLIKKSDKILAGQSSVTPPKYIEVTFLPTLGRFSYRKVYVNAICITIGKTNADCVSRSIVGSSFLREFECTVEI